MWIPAQQCPNCGSISAGVYVVEMKRFFRCDNLYSNVIVGDVSVVKSRCRMHFTATQSVNANDSISSYLLMIRTRFIPIRDNPSTDNLREAQAVPLPLSMFSAVASADCAAARRAMGTR